MALAAIALACVPASAAALTPSQAGYLRAAERGVAKTNQWWSRGRHWYSSVLGGHQAATLWQVVPLFEALNGIQMADPSPQHRHDLNRFAWGAQRYLNPNLEPAPGFGNHQGQREEGKTTWFDDNGWWGLAFLDAYRATGNARYLTDAEIAQNFISVGGWDATPGRPGGLWWNTNDSFYAGESLAGGTLLSARLYSITHDQHYLDDAMKFIRWGDVWLTDPITGLYARLRRPGTYGQTYYQQASASAADVKALTKNSDEAAKLEAAGGGVATEGGAQIANNYPPFDASPMPYVNGPMILAHRIICDATGAQSYCDRADQLAATTLQVYQRFSMGPQFDFWYARTMLEFALDDQTGDWYGIVQSNAQSALHRARDKHGLYLRTWYGMKASQASAPKGSLQLHAANAALFAWMAALGR